MSIYLTSLQVSPISEDALAELRKRVGTKLPRGYEDLVRTLGAGSYCGLFDITDPSCSADAGRLDQVADYLGEFWPNNAFRVGAEMLEHESHFGSTVDGDEFVYFPRLDGKVLIFPRHDDRVLQLARGFADPIDWVTAAGEPAGPATDQFRYFSPERPCRIVELFTADEANIDEVSLDLERHVGEIDHTLTGEEYRLHFIQRIGGEVQLTQTPDDPRVGVRIAHDLSAESGVHPFVAALISRGFFKT